jgi:6-phosphogluconolactonase
MPGGMANQNIHILENEGDLAQKVASEVLAEARRAVARHDKFTWAVSGGKTPESLFRILAAPPFQSEMPWDKVHVFIVDERFVPPDHADSNYRMLRETLLQKVPIHPAQVHAVPTQCGSVGEAAMEYERGLKFFFGDVEFPRFDLILLGLGEDGHTASLFPDTAALEEKKRWAVDVLPPKAPHARVTLTFPVLNNAARVMFLSAGAKKQAILKDVLQASEQNRYPAQRVRPASGFAEWWIDPPASGGLAR